MPLPMLNTVVQKLPDSLFYNFEIKTYRLFDFSVVRPLVALIKDQLPNLRGTHGEISISQDEPTKLLRQQLRPS